MKTQYFISHHSSNVKILYKILQGYLTIKNYFEDRKFFCMYEYIWSVYMHTHNTHIFVQWVGREFVYNLSRVLENLIVLKLIDEKSF